MPLIFHITTRDAWAEAQATGAYTADSLRSEGFIHCSQADQVGWVANTRFRGRTDLLLLHVDESRVGADVRRENLEGGHWLFPHASTARCRSRRWPAPRRWYPPPTAPTTSPESWPLVSSPRGARCPSDGASGV